MHISNKTAHLHKMVYDFNNLYLKAAGQNLLVSLAKLSWNYINFADVLWQKSVAWLGGGARQSATWHKERRLLDALFLAIRNLSSFNWGQGWSNDRCPMWNMYICYCRVNGNVISIFGVGFCVARPTSMGNARASNRGASDNTDSRASFLCPFVTNKTT